MHPESPLAQEFINRATLPLETRPELREEARADLAARLAHSGAADGEIAAANRRLKDAAPGNSRTLIQALVLLALTAAAVFQLRAVWPELKLVSYAVGYTPTHDVAIESLSAEDWDLINADEILWTTYFAPGKSPALNMPETLHLRHPDDPALLELYAPHYILRNREVPPHYREHWQRIDPDNGIWNVWEAATLDWRTGEAMQLLEQAVAAPRFRSHIPDLRRRQVALTPEFPCTFIGETTRFRLWGAVNRSNPTGFLESSGIYDLFLSWAVAAPMNQEALRKLFKLRRAYLARVLEGKHSWRMIEPSLPTFESGTVIAVRLGMPEIATQLFEIEAAANAILPEGALFKNFHKPAPQDLRIMSTPAREVAGDTPLRYDPEIYKPGRLAEYLAAERLIALLAALLAIVMLGFFWLYALMRGRRLNGIAEGLRPLFSAADTMWTIGLGVGVPLLWYVIITRLTPLGCRDFGATAFGNGLVPVQTGSTVLLAAVLLHQAARMRLAKRLALLGMPGDKVGWTIAGFTLLILPVAGCVLWIPVPPRDFLQGVAAACGVPLLWLVWRAGVLPFSSSTAALRGVLVGRVVFFPAATAIAVLLALQPVLLSQETALVAQDRIGRVDPAHGGIPYAEVEAASELSRKLAAIFAEAAKTDSPLPNP